jgi:hypothetical protein
MGNIKYNISDIYVDRTILKKLEKRKEKLISYYGESEIKEKSLPLSYLLPERIINVKHKLPLKILAFSDYHIQDFKPLLDYVKNLKEKPDIIIYAGDSLFRFSPLPLKILDLKSDKGNRYPPMFDVVCLSYKGVRECSGLFSKLFGFILRMPKKLKINVKEKLQQIKNIYSQIQNFKNSSKSFQIFKGLIQDLPIQIEEIKPKEIPISENSLSGIINLIDTQTQLEIYSIYTKKEELVFHLSSIYDDFYEIYKNIDFYKIPIFKLKTDEKYIYYFIPNPERPEKTSSKN